MNADYLKSAKRQFLMYKGIAEKAIAQIDDDKLNWQYNEGSNSIAIIVKHMSGNMISRWTDFFTTDGEKEWRDRDSEFEGEVKSREDLMKIWDKGWTVFLNTLEQIKPEDLSRTIYIRKEAHNVLEALNRQIAHYSYHVGQIVYISKMVAKEEWKSLSIPKRKKN
jgi:uncharacterized damage-inducible protein DinB